METILNFDCFPAGMELFPAMDEDIFKYIKRIIDESDYYLLVIGGRYGSVDKSGKSWTEREYDYAVSRGIPVLVFDHKDFSQLPANKTDQDDRKRKKLIAFKEKASEGRLIKRWTDSKDLALAVATSLKSVLELQPRIGWVRADKVVSADAQKEITKHLDKIERLKAELKEKKANLKKKETDYYTLNLSYRAAKQEIKNHIERIKFLDAEVKRLRASHPELQPQSETFTVKGVSFKMVYVEGGTFMMGANEVDSKAWDTEKPAHAVTLSDYWIGETQVTQALWQAVMGNNPSRFKDDLNRPVEQVTWRDCQNFIKKLNTLIGKHFRLPTEAEWEFAARGGNLSMVYKYAGSDTLSVVAWFRDKSFATGSGSPDNGTQEVATKAPNELGLYDMSGNVYEWCQDWYGRYTSEAQTNPIGPAQGSSRVLRGGGWFSGAGDCRVSGRFSGLTTSNAGSNIGLRLALSTL